MSTDIVLKAYEDMRKGVFLSIIADIVGFAALIILIISIPTILSVIKDVVTSPIATSPKALITEIATNPVVVATLMVVGVLILASIIIGFIGFFFKFIPGVSKLSKADPAYSTPATLIKIGYIVGLLLVLIALLVITSMIISVAYSGISRPGQIIGLLFASLVLFGIGAVFGFIGFIGLIILCFNLDEKEKITGYKIAGILIIIGSVLSFITYVNYFATILLFIAHIMLYFALGESIEKHKRGRIPPQQVIFPPPL